MQISLIEAKTLPEAWFLSLKEVLTKGREYVIERGSYKGHKRKELDFVVIRIEYPNSRPLLPDIPPHLGIPNPVDEEYLNRYLSYLICSDKKEDEEYTYGYYLESQIPEVIRMYKEDGHNTNQACMTIGKPSCIFMSDPPCIRNIDTKIIDNKLHFYVYVRSWACWNGMPANLAGIQLLKEYMAQEIGVEDGEIIAMSKGLHLYDFEWEVAKKRVCF